MELTTRTYHRPPAIGAPVSSPALSRAVSPSLSLPVVHNGVAAVEIATYGDHPQGAYLYVCGTDEAAVARRWDAVAKAFEEMGGVLWPES